MRTINKIILLSVFFIIKTAPAYSQAADIPINSNATFNGEQSLAIDPNNPAHMVVAWMKYHVLPAPAGMVIATSSSTDGGFNWSNPVEIIHYRPHWVSADPTLVFKNDGTLYLGYIDYKSSFDSGAVYVTKSTNGGTVWGPSNKVIDYFDNADLAIDRPWLAIDNSGGTFDGTLYMVTKSIKTDPVPHHIYLMRSTNAGVTWSAPLLVDNAIPSGPTIKSMGVPAVTKSGKLVIAYAIYNPPTQPGFAAATSTNGGASLFNSMIVTQTTGIVTNDTLLQGSYNLSADPTNSLNLVLAYTNKSTTDFDIKRVNSIDGGISWTAPLRICSDPQGNGNNQDMVWANFSTTGKYAAVWRDRRLNSGAQDQPYKIWGNFSIDGGSGFFGEFQLSQTNGPLMIPVDGNDFLGCVLNDTIVYSCWTDKRNTSTNQLFINKFKMLLISTIKNHSAFSSNDIIFPNPNNGNFTIRFNEKENRQIEISDIAGKIIYKTISSEESLNIKLNEAKGIYAVKIISPKKTTSLSLVIE